MYLEDRTVRLQLWDTAGQVMYGSQIQTRKKDKEKNMQNNAPHDDTAKTHLLLPGTISLFDPILYP